MYVARVRADRPSLTAQLVSGARALYASFPSELQIAPDPHAQAMAPPLLALTARALSSVPALAPALHRAIGAASLGMSWHVGLRTLAIDDAARASIAAGATQLVLLGAGLDNRAGRLGGWSRAFEVDHPDMQRYKRARLDAAGVRDDRVLVPVNFEVDRLATSLDRAGFSRETPAFWIWEGVTPYLTKDAVLATLSAVSELSAPGSRLAMTYTRPARDLGPLIQRLATFLGSAVGEHLRAQYHREEMESLLGDKGFRVLSDEADTDFADRYWKDPPGAHPRSIHLFPEWERLAVAERLGA